MTYTCPAPGMPCNSEQPNQEVKLDPSSGPVADYCLMLLEPEKVSFACIISLLMSPSKELADLFH